ncbi:hypothetical protein ATY79_29395 [Rhizobium sp. R693]|nr:hypothetical protein ATY79_29395 [Rhizobium sp. R693]
MKSMSGDSGGCRDNRAVFLVAEGCVARISAPVILIIPYRLPIPAYNNQRRMPWALRADASSGIAQCAVTIALGREDLCMQIFQNQHINPHKAREIRLIATMRMEAASFSTATCQSCSGVSIALNTDPRSVKNEFLLLGF